MGIYAELGVEPIINAAGTITGYGGSLLAPEAAEAMLEASRCYVDMHELHLAAGRRVAQLIGADAAHVCNSASAGIALMAAACITGPDPSKTRRLPGQARRRRFVVQKVHRNPFEVAVLSAGGSFVEIDSSLGQLRRVLSKGAVAVFYTSAWFCPGEALPLRLVSEVAREHGAFVIVDAAAELPPKENLLHFLQEGADMVAFSGGKAIRGPQCSGFILGEADLIEACRLNDSPHLPAIGRTMKMGKEEIAGLVKAVEVYLDKDHAAEASIWELRVQRLIACLQDIQGIRAWRQMPGGIGQLVPHVALSWDPAQLGISFESVVDQLRSGRPRVVVQLVNPSIYDWMADAPAELRVHPHTLTDDEVDTVATRLRAVLAPG